MRIVKRSVHRAARGQNGRVVLLAELLEERNLLSVESVLVEPGAEPEPVGQQDISYLAPQATVGGFETSDRAVAASEPVSLAGGDPFADPLSSMAQEAAGVAPKSLDLADATFAGFDDSAFALDDEACLADAPRQAAFDVADNPPSFNDDAYNGDFADYLDYQVENAPRFDWFDQSLDSEWYYFDYGYEDGFGYDSYYVDDFAAYGAGGGYDAWYGYDWYDGGWYEAWYGYDWYDWGGYDMEPLGYGSARDWASDWWIDPYAWVGGVSLRSASATMAIDATIALEQAAAIGTPAISAMDVTLSNAIEPTVVPPIVTSPVYQQGGAGNSVAPVVAEPMDNADLLLGGRHRQLAAGPATEAPPRAASPAAIEPKIDAETPVIPVPEPTRAVAWVGVDLVPGTGLRQQLRMIYTGLSTATFASASNPASESADAAQTWYLWSLRAAPLLAVNAVAAGAYWARLCRRRGHADGLPAS